MHWNVLRIGIEVGKQFKVSEYFGYVRNIHGYAAARVFH